MPKSFRRTVLRGCILVAGLLAGISTAGSSSSDTARQGPPPGGGNPPRPPAASYAACKGKSAGATCTIATPGGSLSGTCVAPPGKSTSGTDSISCRPSQPPPGGGPGGTADGSSKS